MIALFAKHLGVPKSAVTLVADDAARNKTLHIDGDPADPTAKLS